jgi:hypothetical protein
LAWRNRSARAEEGQILSEEEVGLEELVGPAEERLDFDSPSIHLPLPKISNLRASLRTGVV